MGMDPTTVEAMARLASKQPVAQLQQAAAVAMLRKVMDAKQQHVAQLVQSIAPPDPNRGRVVDEIV